MYNIFVCTRIISKNLTYKSGCLVELSHKIRKFLEKQSRNFFYLKTLANFVPQTNKNIKTMQEYKLSSGITIVDYTDQNLGFKVNNIDTEYMQLLYSKEDGFYISMAGFKMTTSKLDKFNNEYKLMCQSLDEANAILHGLNNQDTEKQEEIDDFNDIMPPSHLISPKSITVDNMVKIKKLIIEYSKVDYSKLTENEVNQIIDTIKNEPSFIVRQNVIAYLMDYKMSFRVPNDDPDITESDISWYNNIKTILVSFHREVDKILTYTDKFNKQ